VEKIRQLHNSRDICLLTTLGVSPSGEVFNVNSECLAASVAGALEASKIIYFTEKEMELRHRIHGNKIQSLRLSDALRLLEYHGISCSKKGFVTMTKRDEEHMNDSDGSNDGHETENKKKQDDTGVKTEMTRDTRDMLLRIGWSIQALEQGVKRAHIISPKYGSVLQELYTRDGSGMLVSGDLYEGIRRATVHDVSGIHELISPLIQAGTLIDRPKATLEKDVDMYYVYTRDNHIVACGQLKIFEHGFAEIGCLVVSAGMLSTVQVVLERK
jgi:amino-acid N-acetyltransferase